MKAKLLSVAVLAAIAGVAHAAPIDGTAAVDVTLRIAGASAQDPVLMKYLNEDVCGGSSTGMTYSSAPTWSGAGAASNIYLAGGAANNYWAVACNATGPDAAAIGVSGKNILVTKRSAGGSFFGVNNVLSGVAQNGIDMTTCGAVAGNASTCSATPEATHVADIGLADVEAPLFEKVGGQAAAPAVTAGHKISGLALQGFGVAVSPELYQALVAKQFITPAASSTVSACGVSATFDASSVYVAGTITGTPTDSVACQPSLTKADVMSAYTAADVLSTDWTPVVGAYGTGKAVYACRREDTSGTEMSFRTYFLNAGAYASYPGSKAQGTAASSTATHIWVENGSTGNQKNCLNHASGITPAGAFAIGYLSLENAPGTMGTQYRFVKINGVSPDYDAYGKQKQSIVDGTYDFAFESVGYFANSLSATTSTQAKFIKNFANQTNSVAAGTIDGRGLAVVPKGLTVNSLNPNRIARATRNGNSFAPLQLQF